MLASPAPNGHKKMGFWGRSAKWAQKEGFWGRRTSPSLNGLRKRDFRSATHQKWGFWVSHASEMDSERGILGQPRIRNGLRKGDFGSAPWRQREAGSEMGVLGVSARQNGHRKRHFGCVILGAPCCPSTERVQKAAFWDRSKRKTTKKKDPGSSIWGRARIPGAHRAAEAGFGAGVTAPRVLTPLTWIFPASFLKGFVLFFGVFVIVFSNF